MGGVACKQTTEPEAPVEKTKYTISFDSGVKSITVEEGTAATKPTDPEKTGYTFGGWLNGKAAYDWTQPVTSNLSLTAKWTAIKYTITYLPEGVKSDNPTTYTIETETFALTDPTNQPVEGKPYFVAWHNGKKPAEGEWAIVDSIKKGTTGNKTFYAEFSAEESCVVKFMSGTTEVESTKVKKGDKITLPNDFEKYSLFSDADCTEAFDTNTAITADTTIYVKLKTFTISYKVLPFDEVYPVEGETNGTMTVEYGKVFTDEEINALAEVIDGYAYKGVFTDKACTVPFDNTQAITSDLTVYVLYEEVVEEDPTKAALATTLEFNKEYTGYLEFTYGNVNSGDGWQNVTASGIYLNLPKDSLAENGTVKVVYSISGISENATSVTTQGVFDNWGWKDTIYSTADGTEIVKTWTITAEGITTMADSDYASFKIVPQYGKADCANFVGTKIKVVVSNLKVTYTPPRTLVADGEPVEIEFDQWGNMAESAFEGYSDDDVLILTYTIEGSVDGVVGWGCGKISSYGDSTKGKDIPVKQLGENVFTISYAEFKDWLPIKHPEYNITGLNWNMYKQGSATPTRVSAKMQKMKVQE